MSEFNIEFVSTDSSAREQILVNGKNLCIESYCYERMWLYIKDRELFIELSSVPIGKLFSVVESISIDVETFKGTPLKVELKSEVFLHTGKNWSEASLEFDLEEWNNPWTIKQYFNSFLENVQFVQDAEISCEIYGEDKKTGEPLYETLNGIGIGLPIDNLFVSLGDIYQRVSKSCAEIADKVDRDLTSIFDGSKIERCIEFPPEYHLAGLGILNYFGSYLREKYPEENATVKIEQNGMNVRMIIKSKDGKLQTIEKALHEYELIVTGEEPPEAFSDNNKLIFELRNELRLAQFRLESQQDLIGMQNNRIDKLLNIVGDGLSRNNHIAIDFKPEISLSNTLNINKDIASALGNINELLELLPSNHSSCAIINELEDALVNLEADNDPESVRRSPAMSKFRRLIDNVVDSGSELNAIIKKAESGWEVFSELSEKYNKIAEWCGLPVVPSAIIRKV